MRETLRRARALLHHDAAGGVLLLAASVAALVMANSAGANLYELLLDTPVSVRVGSFAIDKPLLLWINDGLMAVFFFLVGLEMKRELLRGRLSRFRQAILPAVAAAGGMVVPILIYVALNADSPTTRQGWAIPAATDIAFAVGVLALLGARAPSSLKIFLLALAILDDVGAILIIAIFHTADLDVLTLLLAAAGGAVLVALNVCGVTRTAPYLMAGAFIWVCVLKSGVHATLAGVVVALAIPLTRRDEGRPSLLEKFEERLHPWVAFAILPLFAFANAGVSLDGLSMDKLLAPMPLGIALGLVVGKPVGVVGATLLAVAIRLGRKPEGSTWAQIVGVGMLAGIGFTMSLFIGMLAFDEPRHAAQLRLGVLAGSLVSAMAGYVVLRLAAPARSGTPG